MPVITGAIIGGVATLGAGAMGARSARKQSEMQKQFAKKGVSWRVADAKRAGIHPLYALGANLPQYSPVHDPMADSLATAGQNIGAAIASRKTPYQKQAENLALAQAQASLDRTYAETALLQSERLKTINGQFQWLPEENIPEKGNVSTVFGGQAVPLSRGVPSDYVTPKAPDLPSASSSNPGIMAGIPPAMRAYAWPGIGPVLLPGGVSGDASEALESISESIPTMLAVIRANYQEYGAQRAHDLINLFTGGAWNWSGRNVKALSEFMRGNPFQRSRGAK